MFIIFPNIVNLILADITKLILNYTYMTPKIAASLSLFRLNIPTRNLKKAKRKFETNFYSKILIIK